MRLFVAVVPPPNVRQAALREAGALPWEGNIRWLPPENVHLTLEFLGDTPETAMHELNDALAVVCERHRVLDLTLEGVGAFPSTRRARVLWIGVGRGSEPLRALAADVEETLGNLGFAREKRPFHPHATLGRSRHGKARLETSQREVNVGPLPFRVERVELVESRRSQERAIYSTVTSYPLRGGPELNNGEQWPDRHQDKEEYQNHSD